MFDYEANRILGRKEAISNAGAQMVLQIAKSITDQLDQQGEKACFLAGVSIVPLAGLAVIFGDHPSGESIQATPDDVSFGACYVIACIEAHPNGLIAGFSAEIVDKAVQMYKTLFGREYPLHPDAKRVLAEMATKSQDGIPDHLKSFLRH